VRTPANQFPGITTSMTLDTDTEWNGDDYSPSTATRTWGSYTGGARVGEFNTRSFVANTPGAFTARFIIDPLDRLMESPAQGPLDATCTNAWCQQNFANNQRAANYIVAGPADLVIDDFYLVDGSGIERTVFAPGENIFPVVEIRNASTNTAYSTDQTDPQTYTEIYGNAASTVAQNTVSPDGVRIEHGQFAGGYSDIYHCRPTPGNKCSQFYSQLAFDSSISGPKTARVFVNYNHQVYESNYSNNQATASYTIGYSISGRLYSDLDRDGAYDTGEALANRTVSVTGASTGNDTTDSLGNYTITNLAPGNYQINTTVPSDYVAITQLPTSVTISGANLTGRDILLFPRHNVRGWVYIDLNESGTFDTGETYNLGTAPQIRRNGSTLNVTTNTDGSFLVEGLTAGTSTISYNSLPTGYTMVHPLNGPPPSHSATVGPSCAQATPNPGGTCSTSNNLEDVNFAIKPGEPWIQIYGLDVRFDNGVDNPIPASPNAACGGAYTAVVGSSSTTSGLIFTGDVTAQFGQGSASSQGWVAGGAAYPELFTPISTQVIRTSYGFIKANLRQSNITPINLATVCTINNCTLPASLANGVYEATGDVNLNAYTPAADRDIVILVNGNLRLQGAIDIPTTSTLIVSTAGNTTVASSLGAAASCPAPANGTIEGLFSSDQNFTIESQANCGTSTSDLQLHMQGSVVVNAAQTGGSFVNNRTLCTGNTSYPSFTIRERPDFILNAPDIIRSQSFIWQEVAP
jgi:hypothetical protein